MAMSRGRIDRRLTDRGARLIRLGLTLALTAAGCAPNGSDPQTTATPGSAAGADPTSATFTLARVATDRGGRFEVAYEIRAADDGQGKTPLVFVHGWSCDRSVWHDLLRGADLPAALRQRPLLALDLPGHGDSPAPAEPLSFDLFADAVVAVLDQEGFPSAVLVGHSNGTPVLRHVLRRHPQRVAALVAVDGSFESSFDPEAAQPLIDELAGPESDAITREIAEGMLIDTTPPERRARILEMMLATPPAVRAADFQASLDPALWSDDAIAVPLLVINAEQPGWDDEAYQSQLRRLAPQLEYVAWGDVSHFLMLDEPVRFDESLADFLDRRGL